MKTALLLSGGMDSVAIAYWQRPDVGITVAYGQRGAIAEVRAAAAVCEALGMEHHVIEADLSSLGSGDMAGTEASALAPVSEWWPFRNQMLVTLAAMKAIGLGANKLMIGTLGTDGVHADGTPEFIAAMNALLKCQEGELTLEAPAIDLSGAELVKESRVPHEILAWAHSCHVANEACGVCRGCRKHYETLEELGFEPY
ncbi:7-cyano-7-deazaguanine synthase [Pandoraea apista]|uniref:7-cyano-7-deazaguanine synthase n=1 Tax=Pandoraea apista TaxID=93218 RepID=UPI00058AA2E9|nr:7-cyano-7-deazaguanine synthase [Pandoraea apista]AJE98830.1 ExsB family protein [Pandoraea apista]AKH72910.1 ExsB family protein [Pandoraea apista]AKI61295.1 ExsB family protein [Pandoraea apista]